MTPKRTRQNLIHTIIRQYGMTPDYDDIQKFSTFLADKLISEGWVKVEEPREFWLHKNHVWFNIKSLERYLSTMNVSRGEIIHVREVVEE